MRVLSGSVRWALVALCLLLVAAAVAVVASGRTNRSGQEAIVATAPIQPASVGATSVGPAAAGGHVASSGPAPASTSAAAPTTTLAPAGGRSAAGSASPYSGATPIGPVALTGCPPTTPVPAPSAPSHPTVLVPESQLPTPPSPAPRVQDLASISGKGMFTWEYSLTSGGSVNAIVAQAVSAGLRQVWVRVGDSFDGFYGASFLDSLVPALHRAGVAVIGWGFPYLYDPVGDATWTARAMAWRGPSGARLDGWGADIETASEGTALDAKRASTYLGLVRPDMGGRPLVAIVFPPSTYWLSHYPYQAEAPYVDAFAPMLYWSCLEPGADALMAIQALGSMAPVHLIGQAYNMASVGGRNGSPSGPEIARFLDVARRNGAVGGSFWVWQDMTGPEWTYLTGYRWAGT